jgi:hypothetical protein
MSVQSSNASALDASGIVVSRALHPRLLRARRKRHCELLFTLLITWQCVSAMADTPVSKVSIKEGGSRELCQKYYEVLKAQMLSDLYSIRSTTAPSFYCERPIPEGFQEFTRSNWTKLDIRANINLFIQIETYLRTPSNYEATAPFYEYTLNDKALTRGIESEWIDLGYAKIDLDNSGSLDMIVKYRKAGRHCWTPDDDHKDAFWSNVLLITDKDRKDIDRTGTGLLMRNRDKTFVANKRDIDAAIRLAQQGQRTEVPTPQYEDSPYAPGRIEFQAYDVLTYRNRTYFEVWNEDADSPDYQSLSVFEMKNRDVGMVCKFEFGK